MTSATVGIASTRSDSDSNAADLLREADLALYAAKNAGKRTFRFFEPSLHQAVLMRVQERTELEQAIAGGELLVYYQPIVELRDGRIAGVEALAVGTIRNGAFCSRPSSSRSPRSPGS